LLEEEVIARHNNSCKENSAVETFRSSFISQSAVISMPIFSPFRWLLFAISGKGKAKKSEAVPEPIAKSINAAPLDLKDMLADADITGWEIPEKAKGFDMHAAKFAIIELTVLDPKSLACNSLVMMLINCLKTQLEALAVMVNVIRHNKQFLTHERVHTMYDWIEIMQDRYVCPLLDCFVEDILPALGKEQVIKPESCVYIEQRIHTIDAIKRDLDAIIQTSFALTPRLPSGERVFVLVHSYLQFETHMLRFLEDVEKAIPKRLSGKNSEKDFVELEKNVWDILVLNAGMTLIDGRKVFHEAHAQEMRGVLCNWMGDNDIKSLRSSLGSSRTTYLKSAREDYKATDHGGFVDKWKVAFQNDFNEHRKVQAENSVDHSLSLALNTMAGQRLMKAVNEHIDVDDDDIVLEDMNGVVDDGKNAATLFYGTAKIDSDQESSENRTILMQ
jgi:hypothetical protein